MSNRGSITLAELVGKLDLLEIKCHRCERQGRVALALKIMEPEPVSKPTLTVVPKTKPRRSVL